jgi:hypothetical protein
MGTSFKTVDELVTSVPVTGKNRRRLPWWLFLILIFCVVGVWLGSRDRSQTTKVTVPRPMPMREMEGVQTEPPPPTQLKVGASALLANPVARPKNDKNQSPTVASDSGKTYTRPQPISPMVRRAVVSPAVVAKPMIKPTDKPTTTPVERPITIQLQKATDSIQMLLHVPRDERNRTLRTAVSSRSEVDVLVVVPVGSDARIGRARVMALREDSDIDAMAMLEFTQMPELGALVLLTNARLSPGAKLVIVLAGGLNVEYKLSLNTGTLETRR